MRGANEHSQPASQPCCGTYTRHSYHAWQTYLTALRHELRSSTSDTLRRRDRAPLAGRCYIMPRRRLAACWHRTSSSGSKATGRIQLLAAFQPFAASHPLFKNLPQQSQHVPPPKSARTAAHVHLQIISTAVWCRAVRSVNGVVRAQYSTTGTILDAAWGRFAGSRRAVLCLLQTGVLTVVSTSGDVQDVPLPAVFQRIHPLPAAVLLSVRGLLTVHCARLHRAQSLYSASSVHCAQPWSAKC